MKQDVRPGRLGGRVWAVIGSSALLVALSVGPASAAGGAELTAGSADVAIGAKLSAHLASEFATLTGSDGTITCSAATMTETVRTNPPDAGGAEATATLDKFSFSSCVSDVPRFSGPASVDLLGGSGPLVTFDDDTQIAFDATADFTATLVITVQNSNGSMGCPYNTTLSMDVRNTGSLMAATDQEVDPAVISACPGRFRLTAAFGPVRDVSATDSPELVVN